MGKVPQVQMDSNKVKLKRRSTVGRWPTRKGNSLGGNSNDIIIIVVVRALLLLLIILYFYDNNSSNNSSTYTLYHIIYNTLY